MLERYHWLPDVPLRDGKDALRVNWFEIEVVNARGETTYRNSFVTDLPVDAGTVAELAACGSACWFTAFAMTNVALIRSVGQVEIIFTLLFSRFYLKEHLRSGDVAGLVLVVGGVLLIVLGH